MLPACLMAERPSSSFFDEQIITQSREKFSSILPRKMKPLIKFRLDHWSFLSYLSTIKIQFGFERSTFLLFQFSNQNDLSIRELFLQ